jgi:hypothetical protein
MQRLIWNGEGKEYVLEREHLVFIDVSMRVYMQAPVSTTGVSREFEIRTCRSGLRVDEPHP